MLEENEEAWELWTSILTQWRIGLSGPVGLDYVAVDKIAVWLGITPSRKLFFKIQALEDDFLRNLRDERQSGETPKPCAHPDACRMCTKKCNQRVSE